MSWILQIFLCAWYIEVCGVYSISWLMMTWTCKDPCRQHSCYWPIPDICSQNIAVTPSQGSPHDSALYKFVWQIFICDLCNYRPVLTVKYQRIRYHKIAPFNSVSVDNLVPQSTMASTAMALTNSALITKYILTSYKSKYKPYKFTF